MDAFVHARVYVYIHVHTSMCMRMSVRGLCLCVRTCALKYVHIRITTHATRMYTQAHTQPRTFLGFLYLMERESK